MGEGEGEIMLFGVRVVVDSLRKSVSLNNLSQYELPPSSSCSAAVDATTGGAGGGYASADEAVPYRSSVSRSERKRGVPWTEEEHKLFLTGLKRVGKGDWRGISRNYVKTRTPTQVASHAQKYFLRHTNHNRRRRRTSLFDITTDAVSTNPAEEEQAQAQDQDKNKTGIQSQPLPPKTNNVPNFSMLQPFPATSSTTATPVPVVSQAENLLPLVQHSDATNPSTSTMILFPILPHSLASPVRDLNLDLNLRPIPDPSQLSLNLSLASDQGESIISVS